MKKEIRNSNLTVILIMIGISGVLAIIASIILWLFGCKYIMAFVAALYAVWAAMFFVLNIVFKESHLGFRVINTIYSVPIVVAGFITMLPIITENVLAFIRLRVRVYSIAVLCITYTSKMQEVRTPDQNVKGVLK